MKRDVTLKNLKGSKAEVLGLEGAKATGSRDLRWWVQGRSIGAIVVEKAR
jgi:hypothetical protein